MSTRKRIGAPGIEVRHRRGCRSHDGARCNCEPGYRATAWSAIDKRKTAKTFPTMAAAKAWRQDTQVRIRSGDVCTPAGETVAEAAAVLLAGMESGAIRTHNGTPYKPGVRRDYERSLRLRVLPQFGARMLSDIRRPEVQHFVDGLVAEGLDGSTVKNTLCPLRVLYRRAILRDTVAFNPCEGLDLPAPSGKRERIAAPEEAARLLAALPVNDQPLWATAMYAGLRRGELRALRWTDVDLANGVLRVERGWDDKEGEQSGKTDAARRTVPVAAVLRDYLMEHRVTTTGGVESLVFGSNETPFDPPTLRRRALKAWKEANAKTTAKAAEEGREPEPNELLSPIGLHESRHTFASLMIAAGVNIKAVSVFMGHSSVSVTLDVYGHLLPNAQAEAASALDALLARGATMGNSDPAGRIPQQS